MRCPEVDSVELVEDAFCCLGEYIVQRTPFADAYESAFVASTTVPVPEVPGFDHASAIRNILGSVMVIDNGPVRADGRYNLMAIAGIDARTPAERDSRDYRRIGVCLIAAEPHRVGSTILDPIGEGLEPFGVE